MLLADRFFRRRDGWIDTATGERVLLSVLPAGSLRQQIAWAERCAMLSALRHPMLNPLIDYGAAGPTSLFEAYAPRPPVRATAPEASRFVIHASRFLDAHGVAVPVRQADLLFRAVRAGAASARGRPIGWVLQPRRALENLAELLAAPVRRGLTAVTLSGETGTGLHTATLLLAMAARRDGYVPVSAAALDRWPWLIEELAGRHVFLLSAAGAKAGERAAAAALITRLGLRSTRAHVCIRIGRRDDSSGDAVHLERMRITSMMTMVYVDPDCGPAAGDVFEAARRSEGLPGLFLSQLGAAYFDRMPSTSLTVHESTAAYQPEEARSPVAAGPARSRIGSVVWRARSRAAALESAGRHASAQRLLKRAAQVLEARGDTAEAARCWRELAWSIRRRGLRAIECAEQARRADATAAGQAAAVHVIAVCWTDEGRLLEAEAALRSLIVAASAIDDRPLRDRLQLALARAVCRDGRAAESLTLVDSFADSADPEIACEALLARARAYLQMAEIPPAMRAARAALNAATGIDDPRLLARAHLMLAQALTAAGDLDDGREQVGKGMRVAVKARLPMVMVRLRAALLSALRDLGGPADEIMRLRACLRRSLARPLPALVRRMVESACEEQPTPMRPGTSIDRQGSAIEEFLDIAQRAPDDRAAFNEVLRVLCDRIAAASIIVIAGREGGVIAAGGRSWRDGSAAAMRALTAGTPVSAADYQPPEAAEPIRYGGEVVGAIAARWMLTAAPGPWTGEAMRAAAMALAPHVRNRLDEQPRVEAPAIVGDLIGESESAAALREAIQRASRAPFPVLIEGESGSGKELVARAIHRLSPRHMRRFCAINCAALSDELIEAELFGHTRGAFTGATAERAGLFEEADGGTLFLDEVGELSARAQAKLLRVLQEGEVRRVGENLPRRVDVRIVAATNRRLAQEAAGGRFRNDLRFRLDVLRLVVPPLRERTADIPILARHFWPQAAARVGSRATLGPDALAALSRHDWPGNVRELQNVIAWIAVHAPRRGRVNAASLPAQLASTPIATGSFEAAREEFERRYVRAALAQAGGQRQVAARALGVSRQGLAKMMRRLGIETAADVI